jgi:hypothetical protein
MKIIFFYLIIASICFQAKAQKNYPIEFQINYEPTEFIRDGSTIKGKVSNDSLYIYFLEGFKDDNICVILNNNIVKLKSISTDSIFGTGIADFFQVPKSKADFIELRINDKSIKAFLKDNLNVLEINKKKFNIGHLIKVNFSDKFSAFD